MLLLFLPFNPSQARREFGAVRFIFHNGVPTETKHLCCFAWG